MLFRKSFSAACPPAPCRTAPPSVFFLSLVCPCLKMCLFNGTCPCVSSRRSPFPTPLPPPKHPSGGGVGYTWTSCRASAFHSGGSSASCFSPDSGAPQESPPVDVSVSRYDCSPVFFFPPFRNRFWIPRFLLFLVALISHPLYPGPFPAPQPDWSSNGRCSSHGWRGVPLPPFGPEGHSLGAL